MSGTTADMSLSIEELIVNIADKGLKIQNPDGSFPASNNDIYNESETPVRTTSNWLLTLVEAYNITNNNKFRKSGLKAGSYLSSGEVRPHGYTFHTRESSTDKCNGLVGQAKPIMALAKAGNTYNRQEYISTAIEVYTLHPFNRDLGLWEAVEIDGVKMSFDRTLNHQIIFAAASAEIKDTCCVADAHINHFLSNLSKNVGIHSDGLIRHYIRPRKFKSISTVMKNKRHLSLIRNEIASQYYKYTNSHRKKELGYYPTIIGVLSDLKNHYPEHDIWTDEKILSALQFTETEPYQNQIENISSDFGSTFPGFSHARFVLNFEGENISEMKFWIQRDIDRTYDQETGLLIKGAVDPEFQSSSAFLLTHFTDLDISLELRQQPINN